MLIAAPVTKKMMGWLLGMHVPGMALIIHWIRKLTVKKILTRYCYKYQVTPCICSILSFCRILRTFCPKASALYFWNVAKVVQICNAVKPLFFGSLRMVFRRLSSSELEFHVANLIFFMMKFRGWLLCSFHWQGQLHCWWHVTAFVFFKTKRFSKSTVTVNLEILCFTR